MKIRFDEVKAAVEREDYAWGDVLGAKEEIVKE